MAEPTQNSGHGRDNNRSGGRDREDRERSEFVDKLVGVRRVAKTVKGGLGEAVGINYISRDDKAVLLRQLKRVGDQDYFERGIELAIEQDSLLVEPIDISDLYAVEIDFAEDLERANLFV